VTAQLEKENDELRKALRDILSIAQDCQLECRLTRIEEFVKHTLNAPLKD
jgi:hypothetical protein